VYIGSLPPWCSIVSTTSHSRPSLWWCSFSEYYSEMARKVTALTFQIEKRHVHARRKYASI
jgi:hypothetical protein